MNQLFFLFKNMKYKNMNYSHFLNYIDFYNQGNRTKISIKICFVA